MKKSGLHDMKKQNRNLILRTILDYGSLSRIELAQHSGLSPSTVSSQVSQLLQSGFLQEGDEVASTGGRRRTLIDINNAYGFICVVEVSRLGATLHLLDMALEKIKSITLSEYYISGSELLISITAAIFDQIKDKKYGTLEGIGILFSGDVVESDFHVMYSTSHSSASISLREALMTQFRVTVLEEYSNEYSLTVGMEQAREIENHNSLHLNIGSKIVASITVDGVILPMRDGATANLAPFLGDVQLNEKEGNETSIQMLVNIISILFSIFPLENIFLSSEKEEDYKMLAKIKEVIKEHLCGEHSPIIKLTKLKPNSLLYAMGAMLRKKILLLG